MSSANVKPQRPVFRFAPSSNGRLHLGHAYSALWTHALSKASGGRFLLRIEDIDIARSRPEFVDGIFEDLTWLGLSWELPVLFQSTRFDAYREASERLKSSDLLYSCAATRAEIADAFASGAARDPDGAPIYRPICRSVGANEGPRPCETTGRPRAWRIDLQAAEAAARTGSADPLAYQRWDGAGGFETVTADPGKWGDAIVVRKDTPTSYHLAVVVDDAFQGITHVTRGKDLEAATDLHVLLQRLLGLPTPVYHHHDLIEQDGRKLSKSAGDQSLKSLREAGVAPEEIRGMLGFD